MKSSLLPFAIKFGVGIVFLMIIHSLLMLILGLQEVTFLQYLSFIIVVAGIVWTIKAYRDDALNGYASYGQAASSGLLVSLVISVFFGFYTFIFVKFIDSSYVDKVMERTEKAMIQQGQSDEAIETALQMTQQMTTPPMMGVWSFLTYFVFGAIVTLIASLFLQKEQMSGYHT